MENAAENPFKKALEGAAKGGAATPRPRKQPSKLKELELRTVADLGLVDPQVLERTPTVRDLTVRDLNDLAAEFSGVPSNNPKVAELSLEDIQDIEGVFYNFKVSTGREMASTGVNRLAASSVDVSCCCCTPCCCCAATDMSHTA